MKVLIGSAIRRDPNILREYLKSIENLDIDGLLVDYVFVDDNDDEKSSNSLIDFKKRHKDNTTIIVSDDLTSSNSEFGFLENGLHAWSDDLIAKVALIKDQIIRIAEKGDYDFLFLVDSDIMLQPETLKHLMSLKKDIVSEIFWTDWKATGVTTPAVWMEDENNIVKKSNLFEKDSFYERRETASFYAMLRVPGLYEVGGLGAITLISKRALRKGVSYKKIDNVSFWGEDRHFCVRAKALGLELWVDTNYPAFHVYRECLLPNVKKFYKNGYRDEYAKIKTSPKSPVAPSGNKKIRLLVDSLKRKRRDLIALKNFARRKMFEKRRIVNDKPKLTLMMMVRNEGNRYLKELLERLSPVLDYAVFLDNASTDNTVEVIESCLDGRVDYKIIKNESTGFDNESKARTRLWKETIKTNPDWIFALDADEIPEKRLIEELPNLMHNPKTDIYYLKRYDMWDEKRYREDGLWTPSYWPLLIRYQPKFRYKFRKRRIHCERVPHNATESLSYCYYPLRIKYMGWVKDADKKRKYELYLKLDPDGFFNPIEHYQSILDQNPVLKEFGE